MKALLHKVQLFKNPKYKDVLHWVPLGATWHVIAIIIISSSTHPPTYQSFCHKTFLSQNNWHKIIPVKDFHSISDFWEWWIKGTMLLDHLTCERLTFNGFQLWILFCYVHSPPPPTHTPSVCVGGMTITKYRSYFYSFYWLWLGIKDPENMWKVSSVK